MERKDFHEIFKKYQTFGSYEDEEYEPCFAFNNRWKADQFEDELYNWIEAQRAKDRAEFDLSEEQWRMVLYSISGNGLAGHKSGDFYDKYKEEFNPESFDIEEFSKLTFKLLAIKKKSKFNSSNT